MDTLNEAAQQRNLYSIGSTVSRRVAAAAANAVRHLDICQLMILGLQLQTTLFFDHALNKSIDWYY